MMMVNMPTRVPNIPNANVKSPDQATGRQPGQSQTNEHHRANHRFGNACLLMPVPGRQNFEADHRRREQRQCADQDDNANDPDHEPTSIPSLLDVTTPSIPEKPSATRVWSKRIGSSETRFRATLLDNRRDVPRADERCSITV
jgi:hypothetical protein